VTSDHQRAGVSGHNRHGRNRQIDNLVQRGNLAVDRAAPGHVNHWKAIRVQDIARDGPSRAAIRGIREVIAGGAIQTPVPRDGEAMNFKGGASPR